MKTSGRVMVLLACLVAGMARAEERVALFAGETAVLELASFRIFAAGSRLVVHGAGGASRDEPLPATRYFRGAVRGERSSLVVAAVERDGSRRGLVVARGRRFLLAGDAAGWVARPDPAAAGKYDGLCGADRAADLGPGAETAAGAGPAVAADRAAVVAVETDWELYAQLGSAAAVARHVGDVFATVAAVYRRDLGVDVTVGDLFVWADSADPFTVESNFLDALYELGDHWHAEHAGVDRTLAHFVSGKPGIQGGIAYHGVLCRADAPVAGGHWGGGYSLTGSHLAFGAFRDAYVTAHEIGHNFRAYHSHCFNDLPALGDPEVDRCFSGDVRNDGHACYAGPTSLPADGGSIMSYCHLLAGGYGNVTLSLGAAGAFGTGSQRVVDRMREHAATVSCLVAVAPPLFADGFESGDTAAWSPVAGGL